MRTLTPTQHQEAMQLLFNQICDPEDWKGPIDAVVPWDMANVYMQAIEHMTAVKPNCVLIHESPIGTAARLTCVGYRMGPAGP